MDIPINQQIRYTPSKIELFNNLWVQYVALLIPSVYIIYEIILGNSFRHKVLSSVVKSDIKRPSKSKFD